MGIRPLSYSQPYTSVAPDTFDSRGKDLKLKDRTLCTHHHLFNVHGSHKALRVRQCEGQRLVKLRSPMP